MVALLQMNSLLSKKDSSCAATVPHQDAICEGAPSGGSVKVQQQFLGELCLFRFLRKIVVICLF